MDTLYEWMKKKGYPNIQEAVNTGPNGTINPQMFNMVWEYMKKEGWHEINDLSNATHLIEPGFRIRYITNEAPPEPSSTKRIAENDRYDSLFVEAPRNKFRTAGWCISVNSEEENPYILYRPHVASIGPQSIQYRYISRLFYLPRGGEATRCRKKVKYKKPTEATDFPVYLKDSNGELVTVYYARNSAIQKRFTSTEKYKRAIKYGWEWGREPFDSGDQGST